jgi:hypothetical protein
MAQGGGLWRPMVHRAQPEHGQWPAHAAWHEILWCGGDLLVTRSLPWQSSWIQPRIATLKPRRGGRKEGLTGEAVGAAAIDGVEGGNCD